MPPTRTDPAYISAAGLKARGWTDALIRTHLGAPDRLADNPHYRKAAPMRLYQVSRVETVEASAAFQEAVTTSAPRKAAARQAVQTKRARLLEALEALVIVVPLLPQDRLTARACAHYNTLQEERDNWDYEPATPQSDPAFLARITVNYLRHALTSYEDELEKTFGKVGVREAYATINAKVYTAIAAAYPALAEACARQQARKAEVEAMRATWR
jgi:hypothetical protein